MTEPARQGEEDARTREGAKPAEVLLRGRALPGFLKNRSFKEKAVLTVVPIIIVISLVFTFEAISTERSILRSEIIKRGETVAAIAARTAELPILSENVELLRKAAQPVRETADVAFVRFSNRLFEPLIHEGAALDSGAVVPPAGEATPRFAERPQYFEFTVPVFTVRAGADIDMFSEAASADAVREHIGWVQVGLSRDVMARTERDIILRGLLFAVLFSSLGVVLVYALISVATRPLHALSSAVKGVRKGEYPEIAVVSSGDEFAKLSEEFNRMSRAIREREGRILASEKELKALFERVEHAIFRLDEHGNIVKANKKFHELCGSVEGFCDLFTAGQEGGRIRKALAGKMKHAEEVVRGTDGSELAVLMSLYPEYEDGVLTGFDGYFVDITEKKKLQDALIHTQKLESVGLLAGGIAHDFNNILTGVIGYASLMKMATAEGDKLRRYADSIEKSALRATRLTQQLLGFARKGKYKPERLNINDTVKELALFLRETFDRNIAIVFDTEENLPPISGDSTQIYQAVLNLCINARDAMPEGGRLYLKTEFYLLRDEKVSEIFQIPAGEYVRLSVTDTGTGMTPEVRKKIFEPFYTTKGVGKGTGLGLAMVYGIVKNHEGYITVYSEPGLGTTVRVYLPRVEGTVEEKRREAIMQGRKSKGTILFIDDEDVVRELGKEILEAYDYRVLLAMHGNEGVRLFNERSGEIDLVILDMVMPEKAGRQIFKEIRSIRPDAKVLLCSGYGHEQYFHEIFEAGAAGFLQKPFQHHDLVGKVEEIIGH